MKISRFADSQIVAIVKTLFRYTEAERTTQRLVISRKD
jgi:hypothetical protein